MITIGNRLDKQQEFKREIKTLQQRINDEINLHRFQVAIRCRECQVTSGWLESYALGVRDWLFQEKIATGTLIGVFPGEWSAGVGAILGILNAGCRFALFDRETPEEQLVTMINELAVEIMLFDNQGKRPNQEKKTNGQVPGRWVSLDEIFKSKPGTVTRAKELNREWPGELSRIYQAGSKGGNEPASVIIKDKPLAHAVDWGTATLTGETGTLLGYTGPFTGTGEFLLDLFSSLCMGGVLCLPGYRQKENNAATLLQWLERCCIQVLTISPGVFGLVSGEKIEPGFFPALQRILIWTDGKEQLRPGDLKPWLNVLGNQVDLLYVYGHLETGIVNTCYRLEPGDERRAVVPVGMAVPGTEVVVLDEEMEPCDEDFVGKVYIKINETGSGYDGEKEKTRERFVYDPLNHDGESGLFRTGLLGKRLDDNNLVLTGREECEEKPADLKKNRESLMAWEGIPLAEKREYYPLSAAQRRLFILQEMDRSSTAYHMYGGLPLGFEPDLGLLKNIFNGLIERHESLRTSFMRVNDEPVQRVHDVNEIGFEIAFDELTGGMSLDIEQYIRGFDLSQAPLLRSGIIRTPDGSWTWWLDMHHIISDGTSYGIFIKEFLALNQGESLPVLKLQYKDFALWQNRLFESGGIGQQERFWLDMYKDAPGLPRLQLTMDHPRPAVFTFEGNVCHFQIKGELARGFRQLGATYGATLFMNILGVLNVLFYKYTGQGDIILGTGIAGRSHQDLQDIMGMFVNTLAMRHFPEGEKSYKDFLAGVANRTLQAFNHQDYPFDVLVDRLGLERQPGCNPLFDICMVVQNLGKGTYPAQGSIPATQPFEQEYIPVTLAGLSGQKATSKFDITFFVIEKGEDIDIDVEYYSRVFEPETIERMTGHFHAIVAAVTAQPGILLKNIEIIPTKEKEQVLFEFNQNWQRTLTDQSFPVLFKEQVKHSRDRIALVFANEALTFAKLEQEITRVAQYLVENKNLSSGEPVGIWMLPGLLRPVAVLGILEAGGVFVPLDPGLPAERIKRIIRDGQIRVMISGKEFTRDLNRLQWECESFAHFLCLDSIDIYNEKEKESSELMDETLWRHVGETAVDDITGGGWVSSFTGIPFSRLEMDEYGDNVLKKLNPLLHHDMRVLEIGCASGITMYRVARRVKHYLGTDLSETIINWNREKIKNDGIENITLAHLPAHEIHTLEEKNFDLIIINSVIQCFHGHFYLRRVLSQCVDLLAGNGTIFIGDIMDQERKEALVQELTAFKYAPENRDKGYQTKTDFSSELFISRGFWEDLACDWPEIEKIEYSSKIYTIKNELTGFRYDTLLTVNKQQKNLGKARPEPGREKHKYQEDQTALNRVNGGISPNTRGLVKNELAYLIYTSGSTGTPKGVAATHQGLVNLCLWHNRYFQVTAHDHASQYAGFGFDASVWEVFPYLLAGASVYILPGEIRLDVEEINLYFHQYDITMAFLPTQMCEQFMELENKSLRLLLTGGDKLRDYTPGDYILYNNYGPTENSVVTTCCAVKHGGFNIPIGKPIDYCGVFILDGDQTHLQPIGVAGELCTWGESLAAGYINNPTLTNERFIKVEKNWFKTRKEGNPFNRVRVVYKTGDLGRWLPAGDIEFLGRKDFQVKIRGFRIETGEIESVLLKHQLVHEAVAELRYEKEDGKGEPFLCAYVVKEKNLKKEELFEYLGDYLPGYMVPVCIVELEALPLTIGGKINRKALPAPHLGLHRDYEAPATMLERKLAGTWADVLKIDGGPGVIGRRDNFFDLGGHSLKATILVSRIHKDLNIKVRLADIFKYQTLGELATVIEKHHADLRYQGIEPVEKREYYPLSSAQERMFIIQAMNRDSTAYNIPLLFPLGTGAIDVLKLEKAFQALIQRHESLRTSFIQINGEPVQQIHDKVEFHLEINETADDIAMIDRPFDLSCAPLVRGVLKRVGNDLTPHYILAVHVHHIVSDGISHTILVRDFNALYRGETLENLTIHYKDFSQWQNHLKEDDSYRRQENYWLDIYQDARELPRLNLPVDHERPAVFSFAGGGMVFSLSGEDADRFRRLHIVRGGSLYMNVLAILNTLFYKYTGETDIIIGSGVAGRPHADLQGVIGMFINMLAMRNHPAGEKKYGDFLAEVIKNSLAGLENQDVQFEELVERLDVVRDLSRNALFDVSMVVQNFQEVQAIPMEQSLPAQGLALGEIMSKFDLTLMVQEAGPNIYFLVEYYRDIFEQPTIERMVRHFKKIIHVVSLHEDICLQDIEMMGEEERAELLLYMNGVKQDAGVGKRIDELLTGQASQVPDRVALVYGEYNLTFRELELRAGQWAGYLIRETRLKLEELVFLVLENPLFQGVAILGIWKAGGAYIPVEPGLPIERLGYMLKDTGARVVMTEKRFESLILDIPGYDPHFHHSIFLDNVDSDEERDIIDREMGSGVSISGAGMRLAYVIFTSGTTGRPKGVAVEHGGVVNMLWYRRQEYGMDEKSVSLQMFSYSFDGFITSFFTPLLSGVKQVLSSREQTIDIRFIREAISRYAVTHFIGVPSLYGTMIATLDKDAMTTLQTITLAGEKPGKHLFRTTLDKKPDLEIVNEYGVTEASVMSTIYRHQEKDDLIKIGKPIANTQLLILDPLFRLQPIGVSGELFISGPGIARGYLNNPDLSNEKFYRGPGGGFSKEPPGGCKMHSFKTGDLARWLQGGVIEYLGRMDLQVKIRGYRVETGEIEARLLELPDIKNAVVLLRQDKGKDDYLCAYVVLDHDGEEPLTKAKMIKRDLSRVLPLYMVPSHIIILDKLPLSGSGKIDRKLLPIPVPGTGGGEVTPPANEHEKILTKIWAEVLGLHADMISVQANFFELGGNSLNLLKVNHLVNEHFQCQLETTIFFQYPTIRTLAAYLNTPTGINEPGMQAGTFKYEEDSNPSQDQPILVQLPGPGKNDLTRETDIAVIGMAVRFPGARNIREYWDNLQKGVESIQFYSNEELLAAGVSTDILAQPNYVKAGVQLEDKECFDAGFFGYVPAEARLMDPQVRIFHECVWEALEDAGYVPGYFKGEIGLYAGSTANFYWEMLGMLTTSQEPGDVDGFTAGQLRNRDFLTSRVAYRLDLRGPAVFIQTACSTSLVAIHLACRGLIGKECDLALAGGVTITGAMQKGYLYQEGMVYSPDGHCRTFDELAQGTISSEGAGVVVLKPLKKAQTDKDHIWGIIKGTAINNDGLGKVGFAAPSVEGQASVIRKAQEIAGIEPRTIRFIEAHGTGTTLGDPVEIQALTQVFGQCKTKYCALGSVKTNMGHLDTAAGVAGFVKTVLALYYRKIPPTLHFNQGNPRIDWNNIPFYVNPHLEDWQNDGFLLRAGVSSFGIGGTNAHAVLEEPRQRSIQVNKNHDNNQRYHLLTLSARNNLSLERMSTNLKDFLQTQKETNPADLAYTLQIGRKPFTHRRIMIYRSINELLEIINTTTPGKTKTHTSSRLNHTIVFMFPGQGSQYINMGKGLYELFPRFRQELDLCFNILDELLLKPGEARAALFKKDDDEMPAKILLNETRLTQPILVALEYALARLLIHWGIEPALMIGHSIGEYTAACLSGVMTLTDTLRLVVLRGRLMQELEPGEMLSVALDEDTVQQLVNNHHPSLSLAAVNSPDNCVVSGTITAITALEATLTARGIRCRRLHTSHAFHSSMMEPVMERFETVAEAIPYHPARIPYMSNVSGMCIGGEKTVKINAKYWTQQLRNTVRFKEGIKNLPLAVNDEPIFIEVGPGHTLCSFIHDLVPTQDKRVNLLRHPQEPMADDGYLLNKIGSLWLHGIEPIWENIYLGEERYRISLPTYPFEKRKFPVDASDWGGLNQLAARFFPPGQQVTTQTVQEKPTKESEDIKEERPDLSTNYVTPASVTEKTLVKIWEDFFHVKPVGTTDHFFELGGDSLKATTLAGKIYREMEVEVPVAEFFARPCIQELAVYIDSTVKHRFIAIEPVEDKEYYPVSSAQQRVYFRHCLNPGILLYNMPQVIELSGEIHIETLEKTLGQLIERHESLRTAFFLVDGQPVQRIFPSVLFRVERLEKVEGFVRGFDLEQAPLLRMGVYCPKAGLPVIVLDMHHIITDGISTGVLVRDFHQLQLGEELPVLTLRYRDYTLWQYEFLQSEKKQQQEEYWLNQFGWGREVLPVLGLPADFPYPGEGRRTYVGGKVWFEVEAPLLLQVKERVKVEGTTLHMVLMAVFFVLLYKYTGKEDIVVGIGIAGRRYPGLEQIVGLFINALAIRTLPRGELTFSEYLMLVHEQGLAAYENQDFPFEELVKSLNLQGHTRGNPLFDVAFQLQNMELPQGRVKGGNVSSQESFLFQDKGGVDSVVPEVARYDVTVYGMETGGRVSLQLVYAVELFRVETAQRMARHYLEILEQVIKNKNIKIKDIEISLQLARAQGKILEEETGDFNF